jgi:hypothetical protein
MTHTESHHQPATRGPALLIVAALVVYALAALAGWPQAATEKIVGGHPAVAEPAAEHPPAAPAHSAPEPPLPYTVIPFVLLLGAIAVFPLLGPTRHWWESNLNRFYVAALLAAIVVLY